MVEVVPAINAQDKTAYKLMMERVRQFATRIHIDICDGKFADGHTPSLTQVYGLEKASLDLHLMLQDPESQFENAVSLKPELIIYHAESNGDILTLIKRSQEMGIKAGVAILPSTSVNQMANLIEAADHVLIFTGRLGHNGGEFRTDQLSKVGLVRKLKSRIEVSMDGGVNNENAGFIAESGVDVVYAGSFIQKAKDPHLAYQALVDAVRAAGAVS